MAKSSKSTVEILLVRAELTGVPEKRLPLSRNLGSVDLIWPRTGVAKKSAAREMVFKKGVADFRNEEWAKRVLYREEIETHCGVGVTITEPVSIQKLRRFLQLSAKYALKMGSSFAEKALPGYCDVATAPIDALAQMVGEKDAPKAIAQGVVDFTDLPEPGETKTLIIPLKRPTTTAVRSLAVRTTREIGTLTLEIRG